jgi:translin
MDVEEVEKLLLKKEEELDKYLREERGLVRLCSGAIKEVHRGNIEKAKELAGKAKEGFEALPAVAWRKKHVEQEYAEAAVLISIVDGKGVPGHAKIGVGPEAYILGLLDCIGELKRLVFECLRKGEREKAEGYFGEMEKIYEEVGHLHFSSALIPEMRRKQDVGRMQVEDARGKLIK